MNLQEEVSRLKRDGIVKSDVQNSMREKGFSDEEIDIAWNAAPAYVEIQQESAFGWRSVVSIIIAIVAIIRLLYHLSR